jgi:Flp pilus assembly protein TadD
LTLIEQGQRQLREGRVDQAISTLERAAALNPDSGVNHYWLAEAWLAKGNAAQAREHHQLARRLLQGRPKWQNRLQVQKRRLLRVK